LQRLNAAEIKEKRRFLIADGMGMGKSLSAILGKEVI
jgi:serine/threonine protein phosphatase PrpC